MHLPVSAARQRHQRDQRDDTWNFAAHAGKAFAHRALFVLCREFRLGTAVLAFGGEVAID